MANIELHAIPPVFEWPLFQDNLWGHMTLRGGTPMFVAYDPQ